MPVSRHIAGQGSWYKRTGLFFAAPGQGGGLSLAARLCQDAIDAFLFSPDAGISSEGLLADATKREDTADSCCSTPPLMPWYDHSAPPWEF